MDTKKAQNLTSCNFLNPNRGLKKTIQIVKTKRKFTEREREGEVEKTNNGVSGAVDEPLGDIPHLDYESA